MEEGEVFLEEGGWGGGGGGYAGDMGVVGRGGGGWWRGAGEGREGTEGGRLLVHRVEGCWVGEGWCTYSSSTASRGPLVDRRGMATVEGVQG